MTLQLKLDLKMYVSPFKINFEQASDEYVYLIFTISKNLLFCYRARNVAGGWFIIAAFTNGVITDTVNWV